MDIHAKLLETVDANDPNFESLLNNAIQTEITLLEEELKAKRSLNERKREELAETIIKRKKLKKSIQDHSRLLETMKQASSCLEDYSIFMFKKLNDTKNQLDEESLQGLSLITELEKERDEYRTMWNKYEEEFEKAPLAQKRREVKEELQKMKVKLMISQTNVKAMEKNYRDYIKIQEMRQQKDIIGVAELWLDYRNNVEKQKKLKQEVAEWKSKIAEQEQQIQVLLKEKKDNEKDKLLARYQMPPPIRNQSLVKKIFSQSPISKLTPKIVEKYPDFSISPTVYSIPFDDGDSVSISSSIFEEMCNINEKQNSEETQKVPQIEIEPDVISIISIEDCEFSRGNSPEPSRAKLNEKSLENSEMSKRRSISPLESPIKKKSKDISTQSIIRENKSQAESPVHLEVTKNIEKKVQIQEGPSHLSAKYVPEKPQIDEYSLTLENANSMDSNATLNNSNAGSVNSISFNERNAIQRGSDGYFHSDISIQSNLDTQNNSVNFSADEMSDVRSDVNFNEGNTDNPDPPVTTMTGMFSGQNKRFSFAGFFSK